MCSDCICLSASLSNFNHPRHMLYAHTITQRGNIPLYLCTHRERRESDTTRSNFNHLGLSEFLSFSISIFLPKKTRKQEGRKTKERISYQNQTIITIITTVIVDSGESIHKILQSLTYNTTYTLCIDPNLSLSPSITLQHIINNCSPNEIWIIRWNESTHTPSLLKFSCVLMFLFPLFFLIFWNNINNNNEIWKHKNNKKKSKIWFSFFT